MKCIQTWELYIPTIFKLFAQTKLNELSTHSRIGYIQIDDLTNIEITNNVITVDGHASIFVEVQYGLESDMKKGSGDTYVDRFPMHFCVKLGYDENYYIEHIEYDIDSSGWDE